jgi:hypothetical protein
VCRLAPSRPPLLLLSLLLLALAGGAAARIASRPPSVLIRGVPFVQQRPDFCGEACVEMALRRLGHSVSQDEVFGLTGVSPELGRGAVTWELRRALVKLGFDPGKTWFKVSRKRPQPDLEAQFRALHKDLVDGVPSIICTYYERPGLSEHFRLIVGYDTATDAVIYQEPAEPRGSGRRMARGRFLALWPLRYRDDHDILIRMPLRIDRIKVPARDATRPTPAELAQQVMEVRERAARLRGRFSVVVEPPFVVAGDVAAAELRRVARGSAAELKRHAAKASGRVLTAWVFASRGSYRANARRLTGAEPVVASRYYAEKLHAVLMNLQVER